MTKVISDYDFAYSVGLIRVLETLLLSENEVERMMLASNAEDAFRILNEFDYADNKEGVEDPAEFQKVLNEGLYDIKERLDKVTPDKRVLRIIWHYYDFHNIKTLLKGKLSDKPYDEIKHILSPMGAIPIDSLKSFIYLNTEASFNLNARAEKYFKSRIRMVTEMFEKEKKNPQVIDLFMDQKMMKGIYNIAIDSGNQFLIKYVQKLIDISNIKLFFRMKAQDKGEELFEYAILWNGSVHQSKFRSAFKQNLSDFPDVMKSTVYAKMIAEGYKEYEEKKTLIYLEKLLEDHLTDYIKEAKLSPFGPHPLVAYFLAKQNNALVMRMILVHKLNQVNPEEIKTRLRKLYS